MKILRPAHHTLLTGCPAVPPETGGLLGGHGDIIERVVFDRHAPVLERAKYIPNTVYLDRVLADWAAEGIEFLGLFHSHPSWETAPSDEDKAYFTAVMQSVPKASTLWFPIVIPQQSLYAYIAHRTDDSIVIKSDPVICLEHF